MKATIKAAELVREVCRAAYRGEAAAFVGSGISVPSGLPDWTGLLRPMVDQLGVTLRSAGEDLPLFAQHVVNMRAGNRGSLVAQVKDLIQRSGAKPNDYHRAIARSAIDLVWTTNYDTLLEQAFGSYPAVVRARDADMSLVAEPEAVEIVKAHGCFGRSAPDELVLTREDYEDFFVKRPLIAERLRGDLQSRTFFFAGYGYGDPNIANILVEARRLAQRAPRRRFLLTRIADTGKDGPDAIKRQELWAMDLARVGIECAIVNDYEEYGRTIEEISVGSRGPTLYVTGSHSGPSSLAEEVGRMLAEQKKVRVVLLDGQSTGRSRSLISAFVHRAAEQKIDFRDRLRFFSNPYAADPAMSGNPSLMPRLKEWRASMLRTAHTVLAFDGGMGTRAEVELAADLGCRLILVPELPNGSSREMLKVAEIAARAGPSASKILSQPGWIPSASEVVDWVLAALPEGMN
ncbi:SIR2 family protein [Bradyrhizobium tunisiense]|uniref:SIR2 family protein n=1 Tax=Bradyrhizobium tunisiense TaxID=3278709 RepID=UPI0035DC3F0F